MSDGVWAALITGGAGLSTALLSIFHSWRSDIRLVQYQSKTAAELEGIRSLHQRQLNNAQISEQMRADLRLRMFQDDERRVAEVMQLFRDCYTSANAIVTRRQKEGVDLVDELVELNSNLLCRCLLLPEPLKGAVTNAEDSIRNLLTALSPVPFNRELFTPTQHKVWEALAQLERAASTWRESNIKELLSTEVGRQNAD